MEIYTDKFMSVSHDKNTNVIFHLWKSTSENLNDNDFRKQLTIFKDLIIRNKPKAVYVDTRQFFYTMPPETQKWTSEDFFPAIISVGVKKYGLMVSADIFTQVSIEQTMTEEKEERFATRYFDDLDKARKWAEE